MDTTLTLNHFQQHGHDILVVLGYLTNRFNVAVGHTDKTADQWLKARLCFAVAGGRQRGHGAAMESMFHDDDRGVVDTLTMPVKTRQFNRGFIGLATRITEEHFVHARQGSQLIGQLFLERNTIQIRRMQQLSGLLTQRVHQIRMVMTQGIHRNTRQRIQVAFAFSINKPAPLPMSKGNGLTGISVHHMSHGDFSVDKEIEG